MSDSSPFLTELNFYWDVLHPLRGKCKLSAAEKSFYPMLLNQMMRRKTRWLAFSYKKLEELSGLSRDAVATAIRCGKERKVLDVRETDGGLEYTFQAVSADDYLIQPEADKKEEKSRLQTARKEANESARMTSQRGGLVSADDRFESARRTQTGETPLFNVLKGLKEPPLTPPAGAGEGVGEPTDEEKEAREQDTTPWEETPSEQTSRLKEWFADVWNAYHPAGRVAFKDAKFEFFKINPSEALYREIMTSIAAHYEGRNWQRGMVKNLPEWLRGERWTDTIVPCRGDPFRGEETATEHNIRVVEQMERDRNSGKANDILALFGGTGEP